MAWKEYYHDLIDTQWNVNYCYDGLSVLLQNRFNRYIVECKYVLLYIRKEVISRFNRYIVECKWETVSRVVQSQRDLIDTQWNVNKRFFARYNKLLRRFNRYIVECKSVSISNIPILYRDLIDTQWNVNVKSVRAYMCFHGFNRYIVECKYVTVYVIIFCISRFNRYIVECKFHRYRTISNI